MVTLCIIFSLLLFSKNKVVSRLSTGAVFIMLMFFVPTPWKLHAENIDPGGNGSQYAQFQVVDKDNDGTMDQINFEPQGGGVTVDDTGTIGYAWAENIGWINTDPAGGNVTLSCSDGEGTFHGYWWGQTGSWINLEPTGGGLILTEDGEFSGNIWMQNVGWIKFDCGSALSCVKTEYRCPSDDGGGGGGGGPTEGDPTDPTFCELNPSDPSCNPEPDFCTENPTDPSCLPPPDFCTKNPTDPSCIQPPPEFCEEHPEDSSCITDEPPVVPETPPENPGGPGEETPGGSNENRNQENQSEKFSDSPITFDILDIPALPIAVSQAVQKLREAVEDTPVPAAARAAATAGVAVSFPGLAIRLINAFMGFLGYRKTRRHWGVVYDSVTKQPLDPAVVTLHDARTGVEVASAITDLDGRYSFLAQPGIYSIHAAKTHYVFPSQILAGKSRDELYNDLYFGQAITLQTAGEVLTHDIPMDPSGVDWNETEKRRGNIFSFFTKSDLTIVRILRTFYIVGFILSVLALIIVPAPYNTIIFGIYILILALQMFGFGPTRPGILRRTNGNPISFAIIRVWTPDMLREVSHRVTDKKGQYFILIHAGEYRLTVEEKQSDGTYRRIHTTETIRAKRGVINKKIEVF